jgi:glycosyltransferase involved in cell wall biosynthesis
MALETPVVATDAGGTHDIMTHDVHGLIVPIGDPAALARAIERTLGDRRATLDRVAAARSRVERELSFDRRTRTLESIYEELATVQRGGRADVLTRAAS